MAGLVLLLTAWQLWPLRQLRAATVAPRLDRQHPALEDSTGLLLRRPEDLNLLELLQQQRVASRLEELHAAGSSALPVSLQKPALGAGLLLLAAAGLWCLPQQARELKLQRVAVHFPSQASKASPAAASISSTTLAVTPPAYTRQPTFSPPQASFQCPQGSRVRWQVSVAGAGAAAPELEIGLRRLRLQAVAGKPGTFFISQTLNSSTLYRLRLGSTVSDDYAIEVRPDQAPVVRIQTPKPYTLVEFGVRPELPVRATLRDDYGLSRAELVITVAQGQGEAVKFRELRRELSAGLSGQPPQASLSSMLNLPRLGLTYGDELYFYIVARDNQGRQARTDAYLVQWQDTAVASSLDDMSLGAKVAPAYFRSQRQIIIDTEKLLAEKKRLDAATVSSRANALGFDQQSLRLRYGKFMGEEASQSLGAAPRPPIAEEEDEDEHGHAPTAEEEHHDHGHAPANPAQPSPTAGTDELMEPYMHRHDDAETADFLEPAVKAKLRAVLDQMWAAELRLRTGQLAAALPYEYRALRLLKQVQQQTRAYVRKAGFTPPPMPEATLRLTGELAGAAAPQRHREPAPATPPPAARAALRWLQAHPPGSRLAPADARLLEQAGTELSAAALQRPGLYLPALRALRQLIAEARAGRSACQDCRAPVERALTDLLAEPRPTPVAAPAGDRMSRRYFQELSQ
ncbi:DUF4175 family protein [Hymenobacter saemangeumensis]|uniref:DUF4175 family protein n=2 Tax=Hymenobacter saemangeumensis TaxID=1084522 RepID=A0ABP8I8G6_9BACT